MDVDCGLLSLFPSLVCAGSGNVSGSMCVSQCVCVFRIMQGYVDASSWLLPDHKRDPKTCAAAWYPLKIGSIVSFQLGFSEK